MTTLDPEKTNAPETTELKDDELGQVTGGATERQCECGNWSTNKYCEKCGKKLRGGIHVKS